MLLTDCNCKCESDILEACRLVLNLLINLCDYNAGYY